MHVHNLETTSFANAVNAMYPTFADLGVPNSMKLLSDRLPDADHAAAPIGMRAEGGKPQKLVQLTRHGFHIFRATMSLLHTQNITFQRKPSDALELTGDLPLQSSNRAEEPS